MSHKIVIKRDRPLFKAGLVAAAVGALAVGAWALYSYTRATTVSDFERAQLEVERLREERRTLTRDLRSSRGEIDQLKDQVAYAQRAGEIDSQACDSVKASLGSLQAEVSDLREQLAFYRGIVAPDTSRAGVRVYEFKLVKTPTSNVYRYELVLIQSTRSERQVAGRIALELEGVSHGAQQTLKLDASLLSPAQDLEFSFKYFEEFTGELRVPPGFRPMRILVTLVPATAKVPNVKEQFDWAKTIQP